MTTMLGSYLERSGRWDWFFAPMPQIFLVKNFEIPICRWYCNTHFQGVPWPKMLHNGAHGCLQLIPYFHQFVIPGYIVNWSLFGSLCSQWLFPVWGMAIGDAMNQKGLISSTIVCPSDFPTWLTIWPWPREPAVTLVPSPFLVSSLRASPLGLSM
jgi:hypothetical protein